MPNIPTVALSVRQPWAEAIVRGIKDVENRPRPCIKWLDTPVFIHASATRNLKEVAHFFNRHSNPAIAKHQTLGGDMIIPFPEHEHVGGIVGMALFSCCSTGKHPSIWADEGAYHWGIGAACPLPFSPCKGALGFWKVENRVAPEWLEENRQLIERCYKELLDEPPF